MDLLTGNDRSHISDDLKYKADVDVTSYVADGGQCVTLVDTPGFDVSHEGISDVDILGRITEFLQAKWVPFLILHETPVTGIHSGGQKLNGLIYLYLISDPRMDYMAKKNIEIFSKLCGERNFANVRIVTIDWGVVDEEEGNNREVALLTRYFKHLIDGGAKMVRHVQGRQSARSIVFELIQQPPVTLKIQEELNAGRALGNTSAGAVITKAMQKEHRDEMQIALKDETWQESKDAGDPLDTERGLAKVQVPLQVRRPHGKPSPENSMGSGKSKLNSQGKKGGLCPHLIIVLVLAVVGVLVKHKSL